MSEQGAWRSPWFEVSYPKGPPVLALREAGKREDPAVRFRNMTREELIRTGQRGVRRSEALALLTEGFFRGLCDENDTARLKELLAEQEEARQEAQEEARFRYAHAGMSREEVETMLREGRR